MSDRKELWFRWGKPRRPKVDPAILEATLTSYGLEPWGAGAATGLQRGRLQPGPRRRRSRWVLFTEQPDLAGRRSRFRAIRLAFLGGITMVAIAAATQVGSLDRRQRPGAASYSQAGYWPTPWGEMGGR